MQMENYATSPCELTEIASAVSVGVMSFTNLTKMMLTYMCVMPAGRNFIVSNIAYKSEVELAHDV